MIDKRALAAIGGFAFVAPWIGFSFGEALLCLLGAAIAWAVVGVIDGQLDLGKLQRRFAKEEEPPTASPIANRPSRAPGRTPAGPLTPPPAGGVGGHNNRQFDQLARG